MYIQSATIELPTHYIAMKWGGGGGNSNVASCKLACNLNFGTIGISYIISALFTFQRCCCWNKLRIWWWLSKWNYVVCQHNIAPSRWASRVDDRFQKVSNNVLSRVTRWNIKWPKCGIFQSYRNIFFIGSYGVTFIMLPDIIWNSFMTFENTFMTS